MNLESDTSRSRLDLCLNFSNSIHPYPLVLVQNGVAYEVAQKNLVGSVYWNHRHQCGDLIAWGLKKGLITRSEAGRLERQVGYNGAGKALLARALELRETIYEVFSSIGQGTAPPEKEMRKLNGYLKEALRRSVIAKTDSGYSWKWDEDLAPGEVIIGEIARSAADLLTSHMVKNVFACAGKGCDWLGLDKTKNHTRKWCSMNSCGNRAKAKRYYETHKNATV